MSARVIWSLDTLSPEKGTVAIEQDGSVTIQHGGKRVSGTCKDHVEGRAVQIVASEPLVEEGELTVPAEPADPEED